MTLAQVPAFALGFFAGLGLTTGLFSALFRHRPRFSRPLGHVALVCAVMVGLLCLSAWVTGPRWVAL